MTRDPRSVERKKPGQPKARLDSSSVNVKSWRTVGADKLLNSRLSPLNSQLKKRLVSNYRDSSDSDYPAVGLEETKKKVND